LRAVQVAPLAWELDDAETTAGMVRTLARADSELTTLGARMGKVTAPADLRALHAGFKNSITTEVKCTRKAGTVVENGGNPKASVDSCTRAFVGTTERQKHWRTEITVAARRLGVVLPFWVKKVGVAPK